MDIKTIKIIIILVTIGLIINFGDAINTSYQISSGENRVKENYIIKVNLNTTTKEKLEIINSSCKEEFSEDIKAFSLISIYSSKNCENKFKDILFNDMMKLIKKTN